MAQRREVLRRRYRLLRHLYRFWFCRVVVDPGHTLAALRQYRRYVREWRAYARMPETEELRLIDSYPYLEDRTATTPFDSHYFYQGIWAMNRIARSGARWHLDVGSEVNFVGMLTTHLPVTFVDIRPLEAHGVKHLSCVGGSLLHLPFASASVESLSCLHVAEHIGLGRYGDALNPAGTRQACAELARVLAPGGHLFFSAPVGRPRVCFNAHRIHSPQQILDYFRDLKLVQFSAIADDGTFRQDIDLDDLADAKYACGLFHFTKQP